MSNLCQTSSAKLRQLKLGFDSLQSTFEAAVQSGNFSRFQEQKKEYTELHQTTTIELQLLVRQLVERFVANRQYKNDPVTVQMEGFGAIINGNYVFSENLPWPNILPTCVTTINGSFVSDQTSRLVAPGLQNVFGNFISHTTGEFIAPQLRKVEGHLSASTASNYEVDNLESIGDKLDISTAKGTFTAPRLKTIGDDLWASEVKVFEADSLEHVGRNISLDGAQSICLSSLSDVGNFMQAREIKNLVLPNLSKIGGYLYIPEASVFKAPKLESIGNQVSEWCLDLAGITDLANLDLSAVKNIDGSVIIAAGHPDIIAFFEDLQDRGILQGEIIER